MSGSRTGPWRPALSLALLAAVAATAAPSAAAQSADPAMLSVGATVQGRLQASDPSAFERGRFRTYAFDAVAGERYIITMRSGDFDAYLTAARSVGGVTDVLATNDDGGGGTDARLRFTPPSPGRYLVVAQSLTLEGTGSYTLQIERAGPEPAPEPIRVGQTLRGSLDGHSAVEPNGRPYRMYTLQAGRDERRTITMRSTDFDAYLYIQRRSANGIVDVGSDDDSGGDRDARYTLTGPGEFLILASAFRSDAEGAFTISVEEAPALRRVPPRPIAFGTPVEALLTDLDPQLDDGSHFHLFTFEGRRGDRIRISLESTDFDAFLALGRPGEGGELDVLIGDDDGGEGTDALIETSLDQDGTYLVRATSFFGGQTGAYRLRLDRER
jgi:hypothetical protein